MSKATQAIKNDPKYKAMRLRVLERDGHVCLWCGAEDDLTVDHMTPLVAGGAPYDDDNAQTLCRTCNGRKSDRALTRVPWFDRAWLTRL